MAKVRWRKQALDDLDRLDQWREDDLNLPPIGPAILMLIEEYFGKIDLENVLPGVPVELDHQQIDIRVLLKQRAHVVDSVGVLTSWSVPECKYDDLCGLPQRRIDLGRDVDSVERGSQVLPSRFSPGIVGHADLARFA